MLAYTMYSMSNEERRQSERRRDSVQQPNRLPRQQTSNGHWVKLKNGFSFLDLTILK